MIYKNLSENYGWTPDQINSLTLFQLCVYLGAITPEHGRVKMKMDQALGIAARKRAMRGG